jgi:hypothetical protein
MIANTIIGEEKRKCYIFMIQSRGMEEEKIYLAKAVATMGYFFAVFLATLIAIASCYILLVKNHTTIASGRLANTGELIPGIKLLFIWALDKCVLLPSIFTGLSKQWSTTKTVVFIILFGFLDRGMALIPRISFFSIWSNYQNAEHFVSLCRNGRLEINMSIVIQLLLCSGVIIEFMIRRKRR